MTQLLTEQCSSHQGNGMQPGLRHTCAEWAHDHSLAAVCADNLAVEIIDPDLTLKGLAILHAEIAGGQPLAGTR